MLHTAVRDGNTTLSRPSHTPDWMMMEPWLIVVEALVTRLSWVSRMLKVIVGSYVVAEVGMTVVVGVVSGSSASRARDSRKRYDHRVDSQTSRQGHLFSLLTACMRVRVPSRYCKIKICFTTMSLSTLPTYTSTASFSHQKHDLARLFAFHQVPHGTDALTVRDGRKCSSRC